MVTDDGKNDHKIKGKITMERNAFNNIKKVLNDRMIYVGLRLNMLHLDCDTVCFGILDY